MFPRRSLCLFSRLFSETPAPKEPHYIPISNETGIEKSISEHFPESVFRTFDLAKIPSETSKNYDFKMQKVSYEYIHNLRDIINEKDTGVFERLYTYSFMEYVPIAMAARIFPLGNYEFRIEVYDSANSPLVALSLKKTRYNFEVTRDFEIIHVKYTRDLEADRALLDQYMKDATEQIRSLEREAIAQHSNKEEAEKLFGGMASRFCTKIKKLAALKTSGF